MRSILTARWLIFGSVMAGWAAGQTPGETALIPIDHPAIQYDTRPLDDRVTRLARDLATGKVNLTPTADGYLPGLLKALGINPDSQSLVFSKTSFQAARIDPRNPRALYFSDDAMVGFVRGSDLLEVAAIDPQQGVVFYSFDVDSTPPRFDRRDACLQCHTSPGTLGIPGLLIASSYTDASGMPAFRGGQRITDDRTPFEDRWGGWYVTGTHGGMRHIGNAVGHDPAHPEVLDLHDTQNLTSLAKKFDSRGYLSGVSDIVALMTLEHQTRMTNLMIRTGWEARIAASSANDPAAKAQFDTDLESLVTYMLFADEAKLHGPVVGVSTFTKTFPAARPARPSGAFLARFRSSEAALPLPAQLHGLQRSFRCHARPSEGACLPAALRCPQRARPKREVQASFRWRSSGGPRDPAGDQAGVA